MHHMLFDIDVTRSKKAELSLAALVFSCFFVSSYMQSPFFDPDAFEYQKAELSLSLSLSLRSVFLILPVHACRVYSLILMLLISKS